jgi:hypothetical protein
LGPALQAVTGPTSFPAFAAAVEQALRSISADPHVSSVHTLYDGGATANRQHAPKDGHRAMAAIDLKGKFDKLVDVYPGLAKKIHSGSLKVQLAGDLAQNDDSNKTDQKYLSKALTV